jgi:hypothetical protein
MHKAFWMESYLNSIELIASSQLLFKDNGKMNISFSKFTNNYIATFSTDTANPTIQSLQNYSGKVWQYATSANFSSNETFFVGKQVSSSMNFFILKT